MATKILINWLFTFLLYTGLSEAWSPILNLANRYTVQFPIVGVDFLGNAVVSSMVSDDLINSYPVAIQLKQGVIKNSISFQAVGTVENLNAISVNTQGNAALIWVEAIPNFILRSSVLFKDNWSFPEIVSSSNCSIDNSVLPMINLNQNNGAKTLWNGARNSFCNGLIQSNQYENGWKMPDALFSESQVSALAWKGNQSDKIILSWAQPGGLYSAFFNGSTWNKQRVSSDISSAFPQINCIDINASDHAILLWSGNQNNINSAFFSNGIYTVLPVCSIANNESLLAATVAINVCNEAFALLLITNDQQEATLLAMRYSQGCWSGSQQLDHTSAYLDFPNIGIDCNGNGYALWEHSGRIKYNFFDKSSCQWQDRAATLSDPFVASTQPALNVNSFGSITAVWSAGEVGNQLLQARYVAVDPPAARNFQGKKIKNRYLFQTEYINQLSWSPCESTIVLRYELYRDGELVYSANPHELLYYEDHFKNKNKHSYELFTIFTGEIRSSPNKIVL